MPDVATGERNEPTATLGSEAPDWSWYDPAVEQREKRLIFLVAMPIALAVAMAGTFVAVRLLGNAAALPTYLVLSTVFLALGDELEPRTRPGRHSVFHRVLHRAAHLAISMVIALLVFAAFGWRPELRVL